MRQSEAANTFLEKSDLKTVKLLEKVKEIPEIEPKQEETGEEKPTLAAEETTQPAVEGDEEIRDDNSLETIGQDD